MAQLKRKTIPFKLDTWAEVTAITEEVFKSLPYNRQPKPYMDRHASRYRPPIYHNTFPQGQIHDPDHLRRSRSEEQPLRIASNYWSAALEQD